MNSTYGSDSPIAAFATTPGGGAMTLIRCSGRGAIDLAEQVFSPADKLKAAPGSTVIHGWIASNNEKKEKIDEVLVSVFRAPKSYTGEDSLEICCHGGTVSGKAVMDTLKSAGFRDALPGEFTFRSFMNGKLDLTKAESVMELVSAKTDTGRRHAVARLSGSLETEINKIKNELVNVLSGAEIYLDYSEDEVSADADEIKGMMPQKKIALDALERLKKLSASWQMERLYQEGVTVVIAGRPNAGKSSLFNSLLKEDRSIVTEIPGTTRDWIEAWTSIKGIPIRLVDTAGLRKAADSVEKIGVERSHQLLMEAQLILYLIDGAEGIVLEDRSFVAEQSKPLLLIWNKADIAPPPSMAEKVLSVSAKTGDGLNGLYTAMEEELVRNSQGKEFLEVSSVSVGTARQKGLVDDACTALEEALAMDDKEEPLDLIAPLLREAVNSLGEITGEVSTADILEEMFSRFCVGK